MSRWTMPASWAWWRAFAILMQTSTHVRRVGPRCFQPIGQRDAVHPIADDVDSTLVATDLMHADDIGMIQLSCGTGFVDELQLLLRIELPAPRDLHGDNSIQFRIEGPPNRSESAHPDTGHEFEMADRRQRIRRLLEFVASQAELTAAQFTNNACKRCIGGDIHRLVAMRTANVQATTAIGPRSAVCVPLGVR